MQKFSISVTLLIVGTTSKQRSWLRESIFGAFNICISFFIQQYIIFYILRFRRG